MTKRTTVVALVLCVFLCACSGTAAAQSCILKWAHWVGDPAPPPGASCYKGESWFFTTCTVASSQCPAICWDCLFGTPAGGAPINLATGDTFITQSDLSIPGLGGGLSLSRTWHSMFPFGEAVPTNGMFGQNWRSTYEESISADAYGLVKYVRGNGGIWTLGLSGLNSPYSYALIAPANGGLSVTYDGTYWTLTYNTGEKRIFNAAGYLLSMSDRNGNTTQLTYDASNRLTTVTDPASRHLYFSYANSSSNLVVGVSSDVGISLSYAYDTQGRLATVTKPDLTTVSFQYVPNNPWNLISTVLDTNGKVLEAHTYDSELRGLTSSRAGGVDAITITYPFLIPGPPLDAPP